MLIEHGLEHLERKWIGPQSVLLRFRTEGDTPERVSILVRID